MTVDEVFKELVNHAIKGMMFHEEMANYYNFLNLKGYKMCHEYHFICETKSYRELYGYYMSHFNRLIEKEDLSGQSFTPKSWYTHERKDVDTALKRQSVENAVVTWVKWQKETKALYEKAFKDLMDEGQVTAAMFIKMFLFDATEELKKAEQKHINLKSTNFDINYIISCQQDKCKKYKKKIREKQLV